MRDHKKKMTRRELLAQGASAMGLAALTPSWAAPGQTHSSRGEQHTFGWRG